MSDNMSRFLGDEPEDEGTPAPAAVEQPQRDFEPVPEPEAEPEAPAEPEPAPAEPVEPPAPANGRTVPLSALEAERGKRQDLERRLADLERRQSGGQPAENTAQPPPVPEGIASTLDAKLNTSELLARDKLGDEAVDEAVELFKASAAENPALWHTLYGQRHPYHWLVQQAKQVKLAREIGDDPGAYEARLRAKWEAEMAEKAAAAPDTLSALPLPRTSPAAGLQPSLARARSVAGRVTVDESDESLGDILRRR